MAKLKAYVFEVESERGLDEDRIHKNFFKITGVTDVDYMPSYWGSPVVWTVTFEPPQRWKGINDTLQRLDSAIKVRKEKEGEISETFSKWHDARSREQDNEARKRGMVIYCTPSN